MINVDEIENNRRVENTTIKSEIVTWYVRHNLPMTQGKIHM